MNRLVFSQSLAYLNNFPVATTQEERKEFGGEVMLASMRFMRALGLMVTLLVLKGCYVLSAGTLGVLDAIEDKCDIHPVLIASGNDGGHRCPQPVNFGITVENANDKLRNDICVLEFAVEGGYEMFEAALRAGADPKLCEFETPDTLLLIWLGTSRNCNDPRYLKKFEELGIEPTIPTSEMLGKGFMNCPTAIEYAVSKGADPNAPIQRKTFQIRPLEMAVGSGEPSKVRALIRLGADPNLPTMRTGEPIYEYAKEKWTAPGSRLGKEIWPEMERAFSGK